MRSSVSLLDEWTCNHGRPGPAVKSSRGLLTISVVSALGFPPLDDVFAQDFGHLLGMLYGSLGVGAGRVERRLLPKFVADLALGCG